MENARCSCYVAVVESTNQLIVHVEVGTTWVGKINISHLKFYSVEMAVY